VIAADAAERRDAWPRTPYPPANEGSFPIITPELIASATRRALEQETALATDPVADPATA
jgi:hypothetical protein